MQRRRNKKEKAFLSKWLDLLFQKIYAIKRFLGGSHEIGARTGFGNLIFLKEKCPHIVIHIMLDLTETLFGYIVLWLCFFGVTIA